ncbi:MAG: M23 family metallopeptidase [Bacteroidales bacterium]|nr:M23 family metallopeptidase [Bacteroidales bacterium]
MTRMKYRFNHRSLSFEVEETTFKQRFKKISSYAAIAIVFAVACLLVYANLFTSPKEKRLKRELEETNLQIAYLERRVNLLSHVLKGMEEKDDNLYRVLLDADPSEGRQELWRYAESQPAEQVTAKSLQNLSRRVGVLTVRTRKELDSYAELWTMIRNKDERISHIPAISPVKNPKVVSGFGMRYHPVYKILRRHTGIDLIGKRGQPIYATADGTVSSENPGSGYGISVVINHGYGYQTIYAHLSKANVRPGQKVKRGEVIGQMGSSGIASGTHLHYEVVKNGQKVNPVHFFYGDLTPAEYEQILEDASVVNKALS